MRIPNAAILLVIGDELLYGKTRDLHVQRLSQALTGMGIPVKEAVILGDDPNTQTPH